MRNVINNVGRIENDGYKTADTKNFEGHKAWTKSNAESLMQMAMVGTLGNSFYASSNEVIAEAIDLIKNAKPEHLATAIVAGRNDGFIRAFNIMGLVYLSKKSPKLFKEVFNEVIKTGNDLEDFMNMTRQIRGFGRAIKTAMKDWITQKTNPFYAQKYRRQIADAIQITHYPCKRDPIYDYVLKHYKSEINATDAFEKYPALNALDEVKSLIREGDSKNAMELIEKYRLDVASVFGIGKLDNVVWDSLAKSMGVMMFLKYINKLDEVGVFERNKDLYREKITVRNLQRAKVFPFRLYTAYNNIRNTFVKNHLADVLNDYVSAFNWGKFNDKTWCIAPDVSISMRSKRDTMTATPASVAGMFTGFFYKGLKNAIVVPWADRIYTHDVPRADSVLTHMRAIENAPGRGTTMHLPVDYLIQNDIKVDVFLGITDSEEYSSSRGTGWLDSWRKYKRRNPNAKAILIRVDSYGTNPFGPKEAKDLDIYQVYGWSDSVLKFMEYVI